MMNPVQRKLLTMFVPLIMAVLGLMFIIHDLKHPKVSLDSCQLIGRGKAVQDFKYDARVLYSRSGRWQDDIGLECRTLGKVIINDDVPLPLKPGQRVQLTVKKFHYMPTRYYTSLAVVNPDTAEQASMHPVSNED